VWAAAAVKASLPEYALRSMNSPTIRDVAAKAGVSKSSVSRVLRDSPLVSEQSRSAILQAIDELGYRPNAAARTLVRRRSNVVGVFVTDFHNPFFQDILDGIESVARESDYTPIVVSGKRLAGAEETTLHRLLELQVDGIVCDSARLDRNALLQAARSTPVVMLTRTPELPRVDCVVNDDYAGATLVVEHLASLGHRKIGLIADEKERAGAARIRGYLETMQKLGLADQVQIAPGGFTEAGGYAGAKELIEDGKGVTAIFAATDFAAFGVLDAAWEAGLDVPRDLSVVGYDNTAIAALRRIGLTSVDQSSSKIGATAMEALLARMKKPSLPASRIVLAPALVPRSTSGPAPKVPV
jgi:DNA-binding LacI/PurR family transcriptional regulator